MGDVGRWGNYAVAAIFFAVGLYLLEVIRLPLPNAAQPGIKSKGLLAAFALGLVFGVALGTTPVAGFAYDPGFGIEGSAMATVVLLAGCALVWWLGERRNVTPTDI